jgi:hypothetical protein
MLVVLQESMASAAVSTIIWFKLRIKDDVVSVALVELVGMEISAAKEKVIRVGAAEIEAFRLSNEVMPLPMK